VAGAADVVVLGVPDDALAGVAADVATSIRPGARVIHVSGASGLDVLEPIRAAGGHALAVHPLQTFADVAGALDALAGCAFAVTAHDRADEELGERLARDAGGVPFVIADADRPLYHAAAVFASNYLVVISAAAEEALAAAGVPDPRAALAPLQRATLANIDRLGTRDALTGPAVRGDAGTVERNLAAIDGATPALVAPYVALCRAAMRVAGDRLTAADREALEEVLVRWS
jgi:predicted short-subunit dehydrogenase-like oxidoreductase (DUF2520 family)